MDVVVAATGQHCCEHSGAGVAEKLPPAYAKEILVIAIGPGHGIPLSCDFQNLQESAFLQPRRRQRGNGKLHRSDVLGRCCLRDVTLRAEFSTRHAGRRSWGERKVSPDAYHGDPTRGRADMQARALKDLHVAIAGGEIVPRNHFTSPGMSRDAQIPMIRMISMFEQI
ncbi:hypothetical protein [Paraburkholderia phytofirmans]|uniref:hypothetical protein n=1 Tax=Paraburkholderia phytofirmans TaxID=261302 RepID=UPI0038B714B4